MITVALMIDQPAQQCTHSSFSLWRSHHIRFSLWVNKQYRCPLSSSSSSVVRSPLSSSSSPSPLSQRNEIKSHRNLTATRFDSVQYSSLSAAILRSSSFGLYIYYFTIFRAWVCVRFAIFCLSSLPSGQQPSAYIASDRSLRDSIVSFMCVKFNSNLFSFFFCILRLDIAFVDQFRYVKV